MSASSKGNFTFRRENSDGSTVVVTAEFMPRSACWNLQVKADGKLVERLQSNDLWSDAKARIGGSDRKSAWATDNITIRCDYRDHTILVTAVFVSRTEWWSLHVKVDGDQLDHVTSNKRGLWSDVRQIIAKELIVLDGDDRTPTMPSLSAITEARNTLQ